MSFENLKSRYQGKIHFIGIGGIGMSAIALILKRIGLEVQGSDAARNQNVNILESKGIKCFIGHDEKNISSDVVLVVKTSIIKDDNPEIIAAKENNISIIRRADMLSTIMKEKVGITVSGTHGKTSTTAMVSVMLEAEDLDPTVINGGIINYYGSNAKFGDGEYLVAESDESDGSFVDLPTFIGAVNNIEPEHLEFYGNSFDRAKSYYKQYINQIPAEGIVGLCIDDSEVRKIYEEFKDKKTNLTTYGTSKDADICLSNVSCDLKGLKFDVELKKSGRIFKDVTISAYGIHNATNAMFAVLVADFLGFDEATIRRGLNNFSGVKRRFTKTGEVGGVVIIDDYGHHPTEISAVFRTAKSLLDKNNKLVAVFQPHKYTRTKDLFQEFCNSFSDVDIAIIADIYSAGQDKIEGISAESLIEGIKKTGHKNVLKLNSEKDLARMIKDNTKSGDIVICAGAGNISLWANSLPQDLEKL